jgi:hypothetical protein
MLVLNWSKSAARLGLENRFNLAEKRDADFWKIMFVMDKDS